MAASYPRSPSAKGRRTSLRDRSPSPSSSLDSFEAPSEPPWRRETQHLTPDHRPRSRSPLKNSHSHSPYATYTTAQEQWTGQDPRSSSMQSLRPAESAGGSRRTLLLVYIHGFMGNETSFKSFPAHVHNVLTVTLSESYVVHSKIYPRYRSRKPIEQAADDFGNWITPHENPDTDIILLGHSLGGILAAEVALLRSHSPRSSQAQQHRLLGLVAFDTPFLGMHPGVVGTGLSSLFRSKPDVPEGKANVDDSPTSYSGGESVMSSSASISSSVLSEIPNDPNFNRPFQNDVLITQRKGLEKALYFINKHSDGLTKATREYVKSHVEFGGCMADYPGLKRRYNAIRAMEDVDELSGRTDPQGRLLHRVRFVNYYSASTGRREQPKSPIASPCMEMKEMTLAPQETRSDGRRSGTVTPTTPRMSLEEHRPDGFVVRKLLDDTDADREYFIPTVAPTTDGIQEYDTAGEGKESTGNEAQTPAAMDDKPDKEAGLPPVGPEPTPPPTFDPSQYPDPDHLKIAQKDHSRLVKAYERARKDRDKSIREREKLIAKREKTAKKQAEKVAKTVAANQSVEQREMIKRSTTLNPETYDKQLAKDVEERKSGISSEADIQKIKKQRDRKFCTLPSKDSKTGLRDKTWIRVYMEGVDEVVAHTSLFIAEGETYERLVGDTADRIENWIHEERGFRTALGGLR